MVHFKKISVLTLLLGFIVFGISAFRPQDDPKPKHNFKVLKKDITHEELEKVMNEWKNALGVKCNFCHAPSADSTSHRLDFASDAKPEKDIARHMYKMVARINKKYFSFEKDDKGNTIPAISCVTCHRGNPHPGDAK